MVNSRCLRISSSCPCITPACRLQSVGNRIRKRCNYDSGEGGNQSVVTIKPFYSVFYPYPRPSGRRINKFFSIVSRLLVVSEKYILLLWEPTPSDPRFSLPGTLFIGCPTESNAMISPKKRGLIVARPLAVIRLWPGLGIVRPAVGRPEVCPGLLTSRSPA